MSEPDLLDLICLTLVPGVGPLTTQALLEHFGSAGRALDASVASLKQVPGIGPKLAAKIAQARTTHDPQAELDLCRAHGAWPIPTTAPSYPAALKEVPDPPQLLFLKGDLLPTDALAVGIVGSRRCTPYGARIATRLAASLARAGITVVSGLARGVDVAAHRGALEAGGRTIAVLANGLEHIYPPEHDAIAREIAQSGALISEMPMRRPPMAELFSQRNRIISGLSLGVVVVEATLRSGSLSTARHATEQNREVFAVPGPVDSAASAGALKLLRDGAKLIRHADDVLEDMQALPGLLVADPVETQVPVGLDEMPLRLWEYLAERRSVDELADHIGLPIGAVVGHLMTLELRRLIRRLPGNWYERA